MPNTIFTLIRFVLLLTAFALAATGFLFWTDSQFWWAGELVDQHTQQAIGLVLVAAGLCSAYAAGVLRNAGSSASCATAPR